MTKQRRRSNRIGRAGERAFAAFAELHGVLATKPEEDVGLDFICHVDLDPYSEASEISGSLVGFAVRSTAGSEGRVRMRRDDVDFLLRMDDAAGIAVVTDPITQPKIHHRMLDMEFVNELAAFMASGRASLSLTATSCRGPEDFRGDVLRSLGTGAIERRRLAVAKHRLHDTVPIARIKIERDDREEATVVTTVDFWDMFERMEEQDQRLLYEATFGTPSLLHERLAAMALRRDFVNELDGLPEPYVLGGLVVDHPATLRVEGPCGAAELEFRATGNRKHHGYVHEAGFALTISTRKRLDDLWVHELRAFADPDTALDIAEHPDLWNFLAACAEGAVVIDDGIENWRFAVEQFARLEEFAFFATCLRDASALPDWSPGFAELRDALDPETLTSMEWLATAAHDIDRLPKLAFTLAAEGDDSVHEHPARWRVPTVVNSARAGAVLWLTCEGGELRDGDSCLAGIRTTRYVEARVEVKSARFPKGSTFPEFVLDPEGSAFAVGDGRWEVLDPVDGRGAERFEHL